MLILFGHRGIVTNRRPRSPAGWTGSPFGAHAVACLLVAVWLVTAGRRQAAVTAEIARPVVVGLPVATLGRPRAGGWGHGCWPQGCSWLSRPRAVSPVTPPAAAFRTLSGRRTV
jgi:hypothetical protein